MLVLRVFINSISVPQEQTVGVEASYVKHFFVDGRDYVIVSSQVTFFCKVYTSFHI